MKLVTPFDVLAEQLPYPLPEVFVRFIGLCEVGGALGLVLPGLLRIRPDLTALAAGGLVTIMLGAAMFTRPIRSSWSCFRWWWASWLASSQSAAGEWLGPAGRHPERCCRRRADGRRRRRWMIAGSA
jgi:hypothetical protein